MLYQLSYPAIPPKKGRRILRIAPPCLKHFRDEPAALPSAWLVTRGPFDCNDANPPGVHFFASDCAILCHADHHTRGTTPPDGGTVRKYTPRTTRAVFWDGNPGGVTSIAPRPRRRKCATPGRPSVATPVFGFAGYRGELASWQIDENTKQVHGDGLLYGTVPRVG